MRAALDTYGVPYTYFADIKLRDGNLRQKFDVIVYPHVGGTAISQVNGIAKTGAPLPYKKTADTPNLGVNDQADDIKAYYGHTLTQEVDHTIRGFGGISVTLVNHGTVDADRPGGPAPAPSVAASSRSARIRLRPTSAARMRI